MQVKVFNTDGTIYKNLFRVSINNMSVKNGGSIKTNQFEDILGKYITFEIENRLEGTAYINRFAIGIIASYSYSNGEYTYKINDILKDLMRGSLSGGYESGGPAGIDTLAGNILTQYAGTNAGIDLFYSVSSSLGGSFYYTEKRSCYDAIQELLKQIPSTATYMLNFVNKGIIACLTLEFGTTGNSYNLYNGENNFDDKFVTNLRYELSYETIANYIFYFDNTGTLVGTLDDATSIATYGRHVKVLNLDSADGSETAKAQQYLDKYKNPTPIINDIRIPTIGRFFRLFVGDTIKIMSEGVKNDTFVNNSFIIQDIIYNGRSDDYSLIIGDIINNQYLK